MPILHVLMGAPVSYHIVLSDIVVPSVGLMVLGHVVVHVLLRWVHGFGQWGAGMFTVGCVHDLVLGI